MTPAPAPTPTIDLALARPRYVVVHKPSGMLSVPGVGPTKTDCAIARVRAMFPGASGPMIVHRLDTDTAGLMLVALDPGAQRALSMQFEARSVHKAYTARLEPVGWAATARPGEQIEVDLAMRQERRGKPFQIIDVVEGRTARTRFTMLEPPEREPRGNWAVVRAEPVTGRTHQIRVHAAHPSGLDAPLIGDILYNPRCNPLWPQTPRLFLHAGELAFDDPDTGERMSVRAEPAW